MSVVEMNTANVSEEVVVKKMKTLPAKQKNMMLAIIGFISLLGETDVISEEDAFKYIESLPIYLTIEEQVKYFENDLFNLKRVDKEILKPLVAQHKKANKVKKPRAPRTKKPKPSNDEDTADKPSTPRLPEEEENDNTSQPPKTEKKRGRKAKTQVVQYNKDTAEEEDSSAVAKEGLDQLIQSMDSDATSSLTHEDNIVMDDLADILKEMGEEDMVDEHPASPMTPPPAIVEEEPAKKKKTKASKKTDEDENQDEEKPKTKKVANKKK
jgi:hypothetical protein